MSKNHTYHKETQKRTLILSDFDGTLTNCDTLPLFLHFAGGFRFYLYLPMLLLFVIIYKCKIIKAQQSKEALFSCLFKGYSKEDLDELGEAFSQKLLANPKKYFRKGALEYLLAEREKNSRIVIVSASVDTWIAPFAKALGIEYIATRLYYHNGFFTGKFLGRNCNGHEKASRTRAEIPELSSYVIIKAFGDTKGDLPMLDLAHEKYYQFFQ